MPEYYYTASPESAHEDRHFRAVFAGRTLAFETDAGVFVRYLYHMGDRILLVPASGGYPPLSVPATTPVLGRAYAFRSYL